MRKIIFIAIFIFGSLIFFQNARAVVNGNLGESVFFVVDQKYDSNGRNQVEATLRKIGQRAYFYVENKYFNSLDSIQQNNFLTAQNVLADEFDNVIYPKLTAFYGSEWNPGIDNNSRITFLFTSMADDAGGYFRTNDEFFISEMVDSNEREMIYFNVKYVTNNRAKALIAHEFQHLINFNQKNKILNIDDEVWLNEMRSEYAPTVIGYDDVYAGSNISYREKHFLATPGDPLMEWQNVSEDYGVINFFAQYLADHYGGNIFSSMIKNSKKGIDSVNQALSDKGFNKNFSGIFSDWTIANILNNCSISGGEHCYKNINLSNIKISPTAEYNISNIFTSVSVGGTIQDWSARWYKFSGENFSDKTLRLNFEGKNVSGDFKIPYIEQKINGETVFKYMKLVNDSGMSYIKDFGKEVKSVLVIPASHSINAKAALTSGDEKSFTLSVNVIDDFDVPQEELTEGGTNFVKLELPDGSLVRAKGDYKVYIINGQYKRHILDAKIFNFYSHLSWESINEVDPVILAGYEESFWVRAEGDERVYEINGDKTKHWLNMSAEAFSVSGRQWDAVSVINNAERDFYTTGVDVKF
ncbi:MAG: hypothetical protein AAB397_04045 [Patescibacteria group bacterium]